MAVELRRIREEDLDQLFRWRNHPDIMKWTRQNAPLHMARHKEWFNWQSKDSSTEMFAIWRKAPVALVGVCGLTSVDYVNRRAEFSLYIAPEHQGNKLGKQALIELFFYGFATLGLNSIWGETFDGNPAYKTFEAVGMKQIGIRRKFYYREGTFIDALYYDILRDEVKY